MKTTLHPSIPITRFAVLLVAAALSFGEARAELLTVRHFDIPGSGTPITSTTGPLTVSASNSNAFSNYSDSATADYGLLSANGASYGAAGGTQLSTGAAGWANFSDKLTISAPGLAGQIGHLSYSGQLTGTLFTAIDWGYGALAQVTVDLRIQGVLVFSQEIRQELLAPSSLTQNINQTITGTYDFIFGQEFTLESQLEATVTKRNFGPLAAIAGSAAGSFDWGSITGVTVGPGYTPVTGATHISESGTNYGMAYGVPEPTAATLLGGAGLGLLLRRRRVAA